LLLIEDKKLHRDSSNIQKPAGEIKNLSRLKEKTKANDLDPLRAKTRRKATHLIQDLHQPIGKISRVYIYKERITLHKNERKINSTCEKNKEINLKLFGKDDQTV